MISTTPTVYVVDDEPGVRRGLCRLLDSAGIAASPFASPEEFLRGFEPDAAGCIVLDMEMPVTDGLTLQERLARSGNKLPVIFLSGHADVPRSVQAMKNGAVEFLTKPVKDEVLLAAVAAAFQKDEDARRARAEVAGIKARLALLTPREHEVMEHVISGKLNKQIAGDLGTAEQTVKVHRGRVMEKLKVQSVAELVRLVERTRNGES